MTGSPDSSPSVGENPPPPPEDDAAGSAEPFKIDPIRGAVRREIVGTNWHPGCPVGLDRLRVLTVTYLGFDGDTKVGPLVVHRNVAEEVLGVFRRLLRHDFPIKHIALPPRYRPNLDGYDRTRSVTAGFNCRPVTDGTSWSHHAYGLAVDINPLQNPYVRGDGSTLRRAAQPFRDRGRSAPGMIREGDIVVRSFDRIGWTWGGRWTSIKDYMHFSAVGS
ncbi:MAG: M15 family metallopeptidase [Actinomycetota bacterium]